MIKCKYLDDLDIPIDHYFTNFMKDNDPREERWAKQREEYGFDDRETWNLDKIMIEWIYTRFKMYLEIGGEIINLNTNEILFSYKGKELTQKKAIEVILNKAEEVLIDDLDSSLFYTKDIMLLLGELIPAMWW